MLVQSINWLPIDVRHSKRQKHYTTMHQGSTNKQITVVAILTEIGLIWKKAIKNNEHRK
jgi:hypothetical protein